MPAVPIPLLPGSATFPDGSSENFACGLSRRQGSQSTAKSHFLTLDFDGAGTNTEFAYFSFNAPVNLSTVTLTCTILVTGMVNATTNTVYIQAAISAVSPGDVDTPLEHAFGTASGIELSANATEARRLITGSFNVSPDSWAPGDFVQVCLFRSPANALDTATPDFEYTAGELQYTPQA